MPRITIIMGLPGSGKTTLAKRIASQTGAIRLSADDWMDCLQINLWNESVRAKIESLQRNLIPEILANDNDVIVEWGSWARAERDELRLIASNCASEVFLYYLDEPIEVLFDRISSRGIEDPPITMVDLSNWSRMIERPTESEFALFDNRDENGQFLSNDSV